MPPDVLVHTERINAGEPLRFSDPAGGFCFDALPEGTPGHAELVREGGDGGVVFLQCIDGPANCPVYEDRPLPSQWMFFAADFPEAVFLRTAPQPFGLDELAETRDVMKANTAPAMAHSDNPAGRATHHGLVGFDLLWLAMILPA